MAELSIMKTLLVLGAGALAVYLMDREKGPQRRAQLLEKLIYVGSRGAARLARVSHNPM